MLRAVSRSAAQLCSLLAAFFVFVIAAGAGVGGRISGTVKDTSGAVVPKASVSITNSDTGVRQGLTTDDKGVFAFLDVQVGHYDLEVTSGGFRPYERKGVVVDANDALVV